MNIYGRGTLAGLLLAALVFVFAGSTLTAQDGSKRRTFPYRLERSQEETIRGEPDGEGGCIFTLELSLDYGGGYQAVERRQVSQTDLDTCEATFEVGFIPAEELQRMGIPPVQRVKPSARVAVHPWGCRLPPPCLWNAGIQEAETRDFAGIVTTGVRTGLGWAWNGREMPYFSQTMRQTMGWRLWLSGWVLLGNCQDQPPMGCPEGDPFDLLWKSFFRWFRFRNSIFCADRDTYSLYYPNEVKGWYNGHLTGTTVVNHKGGCVGFLHTDTRLFYIIPDPTDFQEWFMGCLPIGFPCRGAPRVF